MSTSRPSSTPKPVPDFRRLFDSTLSPLLVLAPDFTIVEVNRAYLTATGTRRSIVGRPIFEVFPDNPEDPSADGVTNLRRSLETVVGTGRTDTMALQRYDIPTGDEGGFAERYWSPVNTPVLDADDRVTHIIHRVEDVTEFAGCAGPGTNASGQPPRRRCARRAWRSICSSVRGRSVRSTSSCVG